MNSTPLARSVSYVFWQSSVLKPTVKPVAPFETSSRTCFALASSIEGGAGSSYLTGRALESLAALLVVLGISLVGLDPSVSRVAFAAVLLTCAAGSGISPVRAALGYRSTHIKPTAYSLRMFLAGLLDTGTG